MIYDMYSRMGVRVGCDVMDEYAKKRKESRRKAPGANGKARKGYPSQVGVNITITITTISGAGDGD